ncbi:hypothetical protein [Pseudonocardia acaciae]|uniref:hypothetical protein n=1 Tax=Pseudonocardia acaciae TaxID=551276 RepID=UPI000564352D|nr:hypothetical protein [Pseudonocardia acaciae]
MAVPEHPRPPGAGLPRRPVLLAVAASVIGAATVSATGLLAGCGRSEPDPLTALAARARADAAMLDALRADPALGAQLSARLAPVADARRQHAQALGVELGETANPAPPPAAQGPPPSQDAKQALSRVRTALDDARREAAAAVPRLPRRQAGLVGSIAACCAAYREVLG